MTNERKLLLKYLLKEYKEERKKLQEYDSMKDTILVTNKATGQIYEISKKWYEAHKDKYTIAKPTDFSKGKYHKPRTEPYKLDKNYKTIPPRPAKKS